jgi:hypothetical protein
MPLMQTLVTMGHYLVPFASYAHFVTASPVAKQCRHRPLVGYHLLEQHSCFRHGQFLSEPRHDDLDSSQRSFFKVVRNIGCDQVGCMRVFVERLPPCDDAIAKGALENARINFITASTYVLVHRLILILSSFFFLFFSNHDFI